MAGNVMVLKHASNVPRCALAMEELFASVGFPAGAFTTLLLPSARAEALVDHDAIRAVTLTGSEEAGRALAARAVRHSRRRCSSWGAPIRSSCQVKSSVAAGARLLTGGGRLPGPGFFYAPTVLAGVTPDMAVFDEETFGPVAAVTRAQDADEAVSLANRSRFGLGASLWTGDSERGEALAREIEAGLVFVNGIVKSDPRLPFGGIKASGYGRELSVVGIREFVNAKTVWVR